MARLFEKIYEHNADDKVTDKWFVQLSHEYETERMVLEQKIGDLKVKFQNMDHHRKDGGALLPSCASFWKCRYSRPLYYGN